ncbi:hypothetical protein [Deinococcus sp. QL22]|uniref:hypothetical protein n=1 Tax=Deinococcus sp. QL22 TaxID=2939437 RepID=UPI0020171516|nr:hypothetical protein [Deinococcus sp. QL22]UQN08844.1 hypothetical protein M1R55_19815 [Deinococcus sp. QL22]
MVSRLLAVLFLPGGAQATTPLSGVIIIAHERSDTAGKTYLKANCRTNSILIHARGELWSAADARANLGPQVAYAWDDGFLEELWISRVQQPRAADGSLVHRPRVLNVRDPFALAQQARLTRARWLKVQVDKVSGQRMTLLFDGRELRAGLEVHPECLAAQ